MIEGFPQGDKNKEKPWRLRTQNCIKSAVYGGESISWKPDELVTEHRGETTLCLIRQKVVGKMGLRFSPPFACLLVTLSISSISDW